VSHAAVGAAPLFPAGIQWTASYDELAKLDEGRHMAAFEGLPLEQVLDVDMSLAVSGMRFAVWCAADHWVQLIMCACLCRSI
jgi:hypothetical protein